MPKGRYTHGLYHQDRRLYSRWDAMMARCYRPRTNDFQRYGGSGITVCPEWHDPVIFFAWATANGWEQHLTLERKDGTLGYSPENCRWATIKEQMRNRTSNRSITFGHKTQCMAAWAEELEIPIMVLKARFKRGWDASRALTEPVRSRRNIGD